MLIVVWSYYIITNVLDAWLYVPFSVLAESFSQSIDLNREHILSPIFLKISILFNYVPFVLITIFFDYPLIIDFVPKWL